MRNQLVFGLVLLSLSGMAAANGKFFGEKVPLEVPYQRALIISHDGFQTLVLQSMISIPAEDTERQLVGWVVPVPAVPELASMPAEKAFDQFLLLDYQTQPRVTVISELIFFYAALLFCFTAIIMYARVFTLFLVQNFLPKHYSKQKRISFGKLVVYSLLPLFVVVLLLPNVLATRLGIDGVEIIMEQQIGVYETKVVRSEDSGALVTWLQHNQLSFDENDTEVFDDYIARDWCFVVATLLPDVDEDRAFSSADKLPAPLIMKFRYDKVVYPLALTGTGGHDTKVLIYLVSNAYMACNNELLSLRYAADLGERSWYSKPLLGIDTPEGFLREKDLQQNYLMKYKGTLTPEFMRTDVIFTPTSRDITYREHVRFWRRPPSSPS